MHGLNLNKKLEHVPIIVAIRIGCPKLILRKTKIKEELISQDKKS
jgi:hypothetical protein